MASSTTRLSGPRSRRSVIMSTYRRECSTQRVGVRREVRVLGEDLVGRHERRQLREPAGACRRGREAGRTAPSPRRGRRPGSSRTAATSPGRPSSTRAAPSRSGSACHPAALRSSPMAWPHASRAPAASAPFDDRAVIAPVPELHQRRQTDQHRRLRAERRGTGPVGISSFETPSRTFTPPKWACTTSQQAPDSE